MWEHARKVSDHGGPEARDVIVSVSERLPKVCFPLHGMCWSSAETRCIPNPSLRRGSIALIGRGPVLLVNDRLRRTLGRGGARDCRMAVDSWSGGAGTLDLIVGRLEDGTTDEVQRRSLLQSPALLLLEI